MEMVERILVLQLNQKRLDEVPRAFVIWETLLMEMVERILLLQLESEMDG